MAWAIETVDPDPPIPRSNDKGSSIATFLAFTVVTSHGVASSRIRRPGNVARRGGVLWTDPLADWGVMYQVREPLARAYAKKIVGSARSSTHSRQSWIRVLDGGVSTRRPTRRRA